MRRLFRVAAASTPLTLAAMALSIGGVALIAVEGFNLTVFGALALYFVLWWTFLFAILPLGNRPETETDRLVPGQDLGAPAAPRLREKAMITTLVAAGAFIVALLVFPLARL